MTKRLRPTEKSVGLSFCPFWAKQHKGGMEHAKIWHPGAYKKVREYHPNAPAKIPAERDKEGPL